MNMPHLVRALHSFRASNNDELTFVKGDVITVTQRDDEGWWEGTLHGLTGWFPSNYVKQHSIAGSVEAPLELVTQHRAYRSMVLKDIVDSERNHLTEMHTLIEDFLHPLSRSDILTAGEHRQLVGNLEEVVLEHERLLLALTTTSVEDPAAGCPHTGRLFLGHAPAIRRSQLLYCSTHPRAVCLLEKYRESLSTFMESHGAQSPGIMVLTTGLSKVFRRLDKFPGMLQEYERHLEEGHPDRGDIQRSIHIYNDITSACSLVRRRKEMELEILSGNVRRWEGEPITSLGDIIRMSPVTVGKERKDRYFVLFPSTLVVLSVSPRMSTFIYEGKLPLTGISVNKLADSAEQKNAFEIVGAMVECIQAECSSREDQQSWVDALDSQIHNSHQSASLLTTTQHASVAPPLPPHNAPSARELGSAASTTAAAPVPGQRPSWTAACLRPTPPIRPSLALGREDSGRKSSRHIVYKHKKRVDEFLLDKSFEDDALILRVIEAYCTTSSKARRTVNSSLLEASHAIVEERVVSGSLPLSVPPLSLAEQLQWLQEEVRQLRHQQDEERRRRQRLQLLVRVHLLPDRADIQWDD